METAEKQQKHCVMMENCNYGRRELLILNLVRQGLLGELMHAECGYLHDLRAVKFDYNGEGLWRREHSKTRNGNLDLALLSYPASFEYHDNQIFGLS